MKHFTALLLCFFFTCSSLAQLPLMYFPENYLLRFLDTASFHSCPKENQFLFGGGVLNDSIKEIIRKAPQTIRYHYHSRKIICYDSNSGIRWCGPGCEKCCGEMAELKIHYRSSNQRMKQYKRLLRHIKRHQHVSGKVNMERNDENGTCFYFSDNIFCNAMEVMLSQEDKTLMFVRYH